MCLVNSIYSTVQNHLIVQCIFVFQNMIEKPEDRQIVKENCISMVQCKAIKQLELIEQKKFDDEDIQVIVTVTIIILMLTIVNTYNYNINSCKLDIQVIITVIIIII